MDLLIHRHFYESCRKYNDKPAVQLRTRTGWNRLTYGQLMEMSLKVAGFLVSLGIAKGEKCCLCLENRPEWPAIYMGMAGAGITCVPLDVQLSAREIADFCKDSEARLIFCSSITYQNKTGKDFPARAIVLDAQTSGDDFIDFRKALNRLPASNTLPDVSPDAIASLVYTSGTTGKPKAVLLSHKNLCSNALSLLQTGLCANRDNILAILPLYHSYPFMITLLMPLFAGATITCSSLGLKPEELAGVIKDSGVTIFTGVPQLYTLMYQRIMEKIKVPRFLRQPASFMARLRLRTQFGRSLRIFASGGSRLDPKVGRDLHNLFEVKVIEGYGLTETSPVVTLNPAEQVKFGSVGKPIPGVEIEIAGKSISGEGEILIKGPSVMVGYYRNQEETRQAVKNGWFHSGDLGFIDRDGYLYITGRKKEVIILGSGKTIYPEELEERYTKGPYIREIFIYPHKEERAGVAIETIQAIVVPEFSYFREKKESNFREKIRWELQDIAGSLPSYKRIMGFTLTKDRLPRTALGKIKRREAMKKFVEHKVETIGAAVEALTEEDKKLLAFPQARKIIEELSLLTKKKVTLYNNLELDLGIDSLTRVQLELQLEQAFAVKIPETYFDGAYTVKEVIERLLRLAVSTGEAAPADGTLWEKIVTEMPSKKMMDTVRLEPTLGDKLFTGFFLIFFRWLYKLAWLLTVRKTAELPRSGPFLLISNHASYLDGVALFCSLPFRLVINTYFVGFEAIYNLPLIRWVIKPGRLVPISPDTNSADSLRMIAYLLRHNKIVCVFPEGQRSADGSVYKFKKGVGIVAREMKPACLPVYIRGSYRAWPRQKRLPRLFTRITVVLGRMVGYEDLRQREVKMADEYESIAATVRQEVIKAGAT